MRKVVLVLLLTGASLLFYSCSNNENKVENALAGRWVLDKMLSVKGEGFYKSEVDRKILTFFDSKKFSFEQWNGDVGGKLYGDYVIHTNTNRKLTTIVLIPDIEI